MRNERTTVPGRSVGWLLGSVFLSAAIIVVAIIDASGVLTYYFGTQGLPQKGFAYWVVIRVAVWSLLAILFIFSLIQTVRTWRRSTVWGRILRIASPLLVLGCVWTAGEVREPGIVPGAEGVRVYVREKVDIAGLRSWLEGRSEDDWTEWGYQAYRLKPNVPPPACYVPFEPLFITRSKGVFNVQVAGSFFAWGVAIGPQDMTPDMVTPGSIVLRVQPGAYVWCD